MLVLEDNLMWSPRLVNGLRALGHTPIVMKVVPEKWPSAEAAVVSLSNPAFVAAIPELEARGVRVTAHAGHSETEKLSAGKAAGASRITSHSRLLEKFAEYFPAADEPLPRGDVQLPG